MKSIPLFDRAIESVGDWSGWKRFEDGLPPKVSFDYFIPLEDSMAQLFTIGISFVGGPDYLKRAVESVGDYKDNLVILDSQEDVSLNYAEVGLNFDQVVRPIIPLSHTQSHNWFRAQAIMYHRPFYMVMHNDAEASEDVIEKLLDIAAENADKKWGVIFTNYDALAVYSTRAAIDVGPWDWKLFPSYYSDNDYYRRLKLAGWELVDTGLPVRHVGSHIINHVDKRAKYLNHMLLSGFAREAYIRKWGGPPGEETYTKEFNGDLENPYPDE